MLQFLLILLSSFSFLACSKSNGSPAPSNSSSAQTKVKSLNDAKKQLEGNQLVCEGECPEFVGALFLYHSAKVTDTQITHQLSMCSVNLAGKEKDKVATNEHCVRDILKAGDTFTSEDLWFAEIHFPATKDKPYQKIRAIKLLETSARSTRRSSPDWAIFQLAEALKNRQSAEAVSPDMNQGDLVEMFPVFFDHSTTPVKAVIKRVQCQMDFKGETDIFASSSDSPLFTVSQCSLASVPGNSGRGVYRPGTNELIGVLAKGDLSVASASGTLSPCLPIYRGPRECTYNEDPLYVEVSKQMKYLTEVIEHLADPQAIDIAKFKGLQLLPQFSGEGLNVELQNSAQDFLSFADNNKYPRLKKNLYSLYKQVLFPRGVQCVEAKYVGQDMYIPMIDLSSWDRTQALWQESTHMENGRVVNEIRYVQDKSDTINIMGMKVKTRKQGNEVILEDAGSRALPAPLKKWKWKVPICPLV